MSVKESGPVLADELGPTRAAGDVVREAEELKHVPDPILPSDAEVESHNVSHLPFRSALRVSVAEDFHLVIAKSTRKRRRQNCLCGLRVLQATGRPSTCETAHPYPARALMADLDFKGYRRAILKSDQEPNIVALCDAVKNGWHGEIVPEASPKARARVTEKSNVLFNLCTDLPSKTSWSRNLELRWNPGVRCWLGWSSIVPTFSFFSTRVSRMMATLPICV